MIPILLIIVTALLFPGIIGKTKAVLSGRKGPSILQPLMDIVKLFKKGSVYSEKSTFLFQIAIPIYITAILTAALLIPFQGYRAMISFDGDFVFFAYIMALGRFMMITAAFDTASGFEGMGANREAFYSMLVEPAFFILIGSLAMFTEYNSFQDIFANLHYTSYFSVTIAILSVYLLAQICLVENSRLPVDDPKTHLELTMVHEVMVLDHSGFDLALIQIANGLKFAIFGALIANCLMIESWGLVFKIPFYLIIQGSFAYSIGLFESFRARNKMVYNSQFIINLSAVAILTIFVVLIIKQNI